MIKEDILIVKEAIRKVYKNVGDIVVIGSGSVVIELLDRNSWCDELTIREVDIENCDIGSDELNAVLVDYIHSIISQELITKIIVEAAVKTEYDRETIIIKLSDGKYYRIND